MSVSSAQVAVRGRVTWLVALEVVFAIATIAVVQATVRWGTTYAGASSSAALAYLAAGLGLMAAGTALLLDGGDRRSRILPVLAGAAWLSAGWIGWQGGFPVARTLAMLTAPMFMPLMLHLAVVYPRWVVPGGSARLAIVATYLVVGGIALLLVLFRDPLVDPDCWTNCTDDVLLASSQPWLASVLAKADVLAALAVGFGIVLVAALRLIRATPTGRGIVAPVLLPMCLVGASIVAQGAGLLAVARQGPEVAMFAILFQVRAWSALLVAIGIGWVIVRGRRSRSALVRIADDLADAPLPGTFAPALARAMNDPTLEVAYWLPTAGRFADGTGTLVADPMRRAGRAVTPIVHRGRTVAVVTHDASETGAIALERAFGAAAGMAVENERLRVELLAQIELLQASRTRIVASGDAERSRLERDLHDGAQLRLLTMLSEIAAAHVRAIRRDQPALAARLAEMSGEAHGLVEELRRIAHGIYPAILAATGLRAALLSLADSAALPVELSGVPEQRLAPEAERTAYAFVAGAVEEGARSGSEVVAVAMTATKHTLEIAIEGGGWGPVTQLGDRVGAARGDLSLHGPILLARIPCA